MEYKTLSIPFVMREPTVYHDLVDYYREFDASHLWAVTKDGDVLCGYEHAPKRLSLGAVAMFPGMKQRGYIEGHCVFLLKDGSIVECREKNTIGEDDIDLKKLPDCRLFNGMEGMRAQKAHLESMRKQLSEEQENLKKELSILKGFFTGKRRKEIEARLAEIETELKGL